MKRNGRAILISDASFAARVSLHKERNHDSGVSILNGGIMSTEKIGTVSMIVSLLGAWFVLKVIMPKYESKIDYMNLSNDESFDRLSARNK